MLWEVNDRPADMYNDAETLANLSKQAGILSANVEKETGEPASLIGRLPHR